jgi:hypothetical protein
MPPFRKPWLRPSSKAGCDETFGPVKKKGRATRVNQMFRLSKRLVSLVVLAQVLYIYSTTELIVFMYQNILKVSIIA